ncbi:VirB8/TrbF family protein [Flavobacterium sp. LAR06]|uniref:VirB8/TrbF family protein n=1 Tax=Flavobacterium sp. LAR06 TaxID=3064897 RepID=UPI0035C0FBE7
MKNLLKIDSLLKFSKTITIISLIITFLSVFVSLAYSFYLNKTLIKEKVYLLDGANGEVYTAKIIKDELTYREPEIYNHLMTFHKYFFDLDQYNYQKNIEKALDLIDNSGKNYYLTLVNEGWYNSLKLNNLVQKIELDSINTNAMVYPYAATVYGKTVVYRYGEENNEKDKQEKKIQIRCNLFDVARTRENPHGLLISNYNIVYHGKE